uniref:NADH-ubiquinone oxidoreductase chain 4L n=1 Tax=Ugyops sp. APL-2018 TaxID=2250388 RepID=A0A3G1RJA4_9HEMI|nr:NADH dehydrogenase subunit 4L [Ugyops sp. APL-2018]
MFFFFFFFFFGFISLFLVRKHYLLSLFCLEFIFLSLFLFIFFYLNFFFYEFYYGVVFLVFGVCDGVLGLSLLIYIVRKFSSDYLDSFNLC